jgi:DNA-directed RNA polymerase specialized sigma24 family protein
MSDCKGQYYTRDNTTLTTGAFKCKLAANAHSHPILSGAVLQFESRELELMGIQKRNANSDDFMRLLARLDPNPEVAWQQYGKLRLKLVTYFESFGHYAEAAELADETLDRISKKPDEYTIEDLPILALGFARNIRKEISKRTAKTVHPMTPDGWPVKEASPEDSIINKIDRERRVECFLKCMRGLISNERVMIFRYYPNENCNLEQLRSRFAEELGISTGTLSKRVARLRSKIESCCAKCSGLASRAPE